MKDVRGLDRYVRVFDPRGGAGVQLPEGGLVSCVDTVPNCASELPEVRMQGAVGALHIECVECGVGGGGEGCATNKGHLVKRREGRGEGCGSASAMQDYGRAVVHIGGAVGIGGQVSSLRESELREEVSYRRKGSGGRWGARKRDGNSVYEHGLSAVVARQWVELRLVEVGGWGAGGVECHAAEAGEAEQRKRRVRELGSSVRGKGEMPRWRGNAWSEGESFLGSETARPKGK